MSTRNLEGLFVPQAVALIGASARPGSVGQVVAANLLAGGFAGDIAFVNSHGGDLLGHPVRTSVAELATAPDLAVIATPAPTVPGLIAELGARGCRAAVVISAGFEGAEAADAARRQALLDAARPHTLRIVGPNCLGVLSPAQGLNASFARGTPPAGGLALVAQSGAVAAALLDWAPGHGLGFSRVVTLGDSLDVDVADVLGFLADDPATRAILLYVESLRHSAKFLREAARAVRAKPVIAIKGGRGAAGAAAAFSHTGALAGADAVYQAAFRRAGVLQLDTLEEVLEAAAAFARIGPVAGDRLAILTNGGGAGVLAADALERDGGRLAELSPSALARIDAVAPASWSRRNPVDILGDARPQLYGEAMAALLEGPGADAVLVINCPTAVADSGDAADAVIAAVAQGPGERPVLTSWIGEAHVADARARLSAAGLPAFDTPEAAVRAFTHLREAARLRAALHDVPLPPPAPGSTAARDWIAAALAEGRTDLTAPEASALLAAYGIPVLPLQVAESAQAAGAAADAIGGTVALKILSRQISHKSDVGGVQLRLIGGVETAAAAEAMAERVRKARPDAVIDGFLVQAMAARPQAQEVLAGLTRDPTFGPVVMVGAGGVAVEVLADRALGLAPLDLALARDMIGRTRISRLLAGYRDRPPADLDALAGALVSLGRLALDLPEVAELDLNPVLCDAEGALAVDARVRLKAAAR